MIQKITLLFILSIACYQNANAHGGGGGTSTYTFDKDNRVEELEAEKKAAEKQQKQESWGDFMKALKKQSGQNKPDVHDNHNDKHSNK